MPRRVAATASYQVQFGAVPAKEPQRGRVPRVARLLALAHRIDVMVRDGEFRDLADAARTIGVSRARMTQIMNLLLLAPGIQEEILEMTVQAGRDRVAERQLRPIAAETDWTRQITAWRCIPCDSIEPCDMIVAEDTHGISDRDRVDKCDVEPHNWLPKGVAWL